MTTNDGLPMPQRVGAIITIALGITMAVLDGTIANVALPSIANDLNTSAGASIWIVNSYQLVITMTLLSLSSLGDIVGYRRIYKIGLLPIFNHVSILCVIRFITYSDYCTYFSGFWCGSFNECEYCVDPPYLPPK